MTPKQLRAWRKSLGLTQLAAANRLELTRMGYVKMEHGERPITRRTRLACWAISQGIIDYHVSRISTVSDGSTVL